ncbi:AAA family ATPase [Taklimakanibacter lacteus]|uniref:AAA family ATPase n=1 Tax=Taklimakanibacter lacteus TaxID=2268456 RepID=UPI000E6723E6
MNCSACGTPAQPGQRFCTSCGTALAAVCSGCGAQNAPTAKFCGQCGSPLGQAAPAAARAPEARAPDSELRPVTVIFADLSGFTALSGERDPEDVQRLLNDYFALADGVIVRLGGTIDKHIGDCVMAVFGAPVAHGDDAERAVAAAIGIREGMAPLAKRYNVTKLDVHSGLAAGTVLAASTGSDMHRPYTITGSSVNLAARLCDLAKAGEILLSGDLAAAIAHRHAVRDFGRHRLDGFAEPMPVFKLAQTGPTNRETSGPRFVGREAEVRQIEHALDMTAQQQSGRIIHIRGDAGIGKTRLLEEATDAARRHGFRCLAAAVMSFGGGSQTQLRRLVTQALLGLGPSLSDDEMTAGIASFAAANGLGERDEAFLHDLMGVMLPAPLARLFSTFDAQGRKAARAATLAKVAVLAAGRGPLFFTIEDLHWIDEDGLDILAPLAQSAQGHPIMLVFTTRPESDPLNAAWRMRAAPTPLTTIDLSALSEKDARRLAEQMFEGKSASVREVLARAAGNPLFLVQLLHHKTGAGGEALPQSIQSLVVARLDRLSESDRRIVQTASVLGQRFAREEIDHLAETANVPMQALIDAFLIRPAGPHFEFVHALVRDATYGTLPKSRRRSLHVKAAEWFRGHDKLLVASHLDQAQDPGAAKAYDEAAQGEWAIYHYESAISLNARALALVEEGAFKAELLTRRGEMLLETGQIAPSLEVWPEALRLAANDDALTCRANIGFAQSLRLVDRFDEAFAALDRAETIADRDRLLLELSRAHYLRGNLLFPKGRLAECLAEHQKALDLARQAGSIEAEIRALGGLGDGHYAQGRMLSAYDAFSRCVELARKEGFGRIEVANLPMCAIAALSKGEWQLAQEHNREAIRLAERAGARRAEMISHHCSYFCLFEADQLVAAREHAVKADEIAIALGAKRFEAESKMFFAELAFADEKPDEARHYAQWAYQLCKETGLNYMGPIVLGMLAELATSESERQGHIAKARAILAAGAPSHNHMFFNSHMMTSALKRGEWQQAEGFAEAMADYTAKEPFPWADFLIQRARILIRHGRGERSAEVKAELTRVAALGRKLNFVRATRALDEAIANRSYVSSGK